MSDIAKDNRRESYEKIQPKVADRKALILGVLEKGPKTAHEIVQELLRDRIIPYYDRNFVSPRLTELKEMELIEVIGSKYERLTERNVSLWKMKEES